MCDCCGAKEAEVLVSTPRMPDVYNKLCTPCARLQVFMLGGKVKQIKQGEQDASVQQQQSTD